MRARSADECRALGWLPGTRLAGDEGFGETTIQITALGERAILAKRVSHRGLDNPGIEGPWRLDCRDWRVVGGAS